MSNNLTQQKHHPIGSSATSPNTMTMTTDRMSAFQSYENYFSTATRRNHVLNNYLTESTKLPPKKRKISIDFCNSADDTCPPSHSSYKCPEDVIVETTTSSSSSRASSIAASSPRSKTTLSFRRNSTDFSFPTSIVPIHKEKVTQARRMNPNATEKDNLPMIKPQPQAPASPLSHTIPSNLKRIRSSASHVEATDTDIGTRHAKDTSTHQPKSKPNTKLQQQQQTMSRKKQKKYVPDRPMSSEEMKAWRREARRVRNRQSAAASRQKVRDRIVELEAEASAWRTRYEDIMAKIALVEQRSTATTKVGTVPK